MSATQANGEAPRIGDRIETVLCDQYELTHVDGEFIDAKDSDGTAIQIKGAQRWISNGANNRTRGRVSIWRQPLEYLLREGGRYLVTVYELDDNDDITPWLTGSFHPEVVRHIAAASWYDGHRKKGQRAKVSWTEFFQGITDG